MPDSILDDLSGPVVRVERLNHYFGVGESRSQVLFDNCIEIGAGQLVILTGPSGSGKTTLLSLIGALRSVQEGGIEVLGRKLTGLAASELVEMRRNIGLIFQMHNLFGSLSAYENVMMAMHLAGCPPHEMRGRGTRILDRLGLGHRLDFRPHSLSGGQRQRVAVARAVVNRPKLVLADEPTAALDQESSLIVVDLLKELVAEDGCTIIMITHDHRMLENVDRIVNIVDGRITSDVRLRDALTICDFLKTVELFQNLTPTELTNVAEHVKKRRYAEGDIIIRQGDIGEEFFLIASGSVVVLGDAPDASQQPRATLGAGGFFGEGALLTGEPRNATVRAAEEVETYVLAKDDFQHALEISASFNDQILRVYFRRH
jgi:putative ABC transport system ATP-binding protein